MKINKPSKSNRIMKIGCHYLKEKFETDLYHEDLVVTTGKDEAVSMTINEAAVLKQKILAVYPGLSVSIMMVGAN